MEGIAPAGACTWLTTGLAAGIAGGAASAGILAEGVDAGAGFLLAAAGAAAAAVLARVRRETIV